MRKIGFVNYTFSLSVCSLLGVGLAVGLIFITKPMPPSKNTLPVISFNNVQLFRSSVEAKTSPFSGPIMDVVKALEKPKMPKVPAVPKMPEERISESEQIYVLGVLPPDTCVLRKGSEILTAKSGEDMKFGKVSQVTSEGVYVNGKFYKMQ